MRKILLLCVFCAVAFCAPSCYDANKIEKPASTAEKAIFVLIDETTLFDESLKEQIINNALKFAEQGNHIFIAKFSAFLHDRYNEVLFDFTLDFPLNQEQRYETNKSVLAKFDKCLKDQLGYVKKNISESIKNAFLKKGDNVAKSDVLYALKDFAQNTISIDEAHDKIVLIASDMLENSSVTSFYSKGKPRLIDSKKELGFVDKNGLFADFGAAKIYIVGAGLNESDKAYVNPQILNSLDSFWREYFKKSNATLIEMGTPSLKREIK